MWQVIELPRKPRSLQDLSLHVLSDIGSKLWEELIRVNDGNAWSDAEAVSWMETCQWLQDQIHSLPPIMANEVCSALIVALKVDKLNWDENVDRFFTALLHPDMTELILIPDNKMEEILYTHLKIPMIPALCMCALSLKKLKRIKILFVRFEHYTRRDMAKVKKILATELEEFTLPRFCTDSLLEIIASSCPRLKRLHINYSRHVSVRGVETILRLRNLEYLSIVETRISENCLVRLARSGILQQLKHFGSTVSCPILVLMIPELKNVNTLELYYSGRQCKSLPCRCFSEFRQLKELKNVVMGGFNFCDLEYSVQQFLEAVGSQLVHLDLYVYNKNWIKNILRHCKSLKCLKVKCFEFDSDYASEQDVSAEQDNLKQESLISLYFEAYYNFNFAYTLFVYILSKCINIRKLSVTCAQTGFTLRVMKDVYVSNPLTHLEELVWYEDRYAIESVTAEYPGLKTVRGLDYIYSRD